MPDFLLHSLPMAGWLVDNNGIVMVCGDAKHMATEVRDVFARLLALRLATGRLVDLVDTTPVQSYFLRLSVEQMALGKDYLAKMRREKRYLEDVWS